MNPPYAYPPPGFVYYYPQPQIVHAVAPGTPHYGGQSLSGPHHHHLHPHAYHVDPNGWYYTHQHQHQHQRPPDAPAPASAPLHPPGLPLPAPPRPPVVAETANEPGPIADTGESAAGVGVHAFWTGRLAPLPGHQSQNVLLPMKGVGTVGASGGKGQLRNGNLKPGAAATPVELLPPRSSFGTAYERAAASPGAASESTLIDEKTGNMPVQVRNLNLKPDVQTTAGTPKELLPRQSFLGTAHERAVASPATASETTLIDEKTNNPGALEGSRKSSSLLTPTKNNRIIENVKNDFVFDKYAESFVPQYLYNIQREPHPLKPLPALPVFPPVSYANSFLISRLITDPVTTPSLLLAAPIAQDAQPAPLSVATYGAHWGDLLRWELDALVTDKEQIVLWKRSVTVARWRDAEFVLAVPGIRENYPFLEVGDLVHLREATPPGEARPGGRWALEARVAALRKQEGLVYIHSPPLKAHVQTYVPLDLQNIKTENGFVVFDVDERVPFVFNVSFAANARPLCAMQAAADAVARVLGADADGKDVNLARQWIFPEVEDFLSQPCAMLRNGEITEAQWADPGLNAEQRLAVTAVSLFQSPVPRLISGPPGTGKTRTVVESVLQIFRVQPEACILVCAPSNPATDTLVSRLQKSLQRHEMLRLNAPNRTFAEVPDSIMQYCYIEDNKFALPPWKQLMTYRVVVTSCLDAGILVRAQCTNAALMALECEIIAPLHPHHLPKHIVQPHWTHLLIDEAAQGSEPELLIPISVVLPDAYGADAKGAFMPQLALCGDIHQLGPSVVSDRARAAELEVSLLERLFERPLYCDYMADVHAQLEAGNMRPPPYTTLVKNYRSHPAILMPPSALFYNDTLRPAARALGRVAWAALGDGDAARLPLRFVGTDAEDNSPDDRASWANPGQVDAVVSIVQALLAEGAASVPPLRAGEIGVMAPWRQQVWALRKQLRNEDLGAVDVGTVEDYQGRENRVVIISCVRSSERFLEEDYKKGMGLMLQRKRMNVAITRAKELLVVVGKGALLKRDPYWKSFLQFCLRNDLYEGPELDLDMDGNYISRLESTLIHSGKYELDPEVEGLMIAGGVAREALRE